MTFVVRVKPVGTIKLLYNFNVWLYTAYGYKYVYLVTNEENMLCFFAFSDKIRCTAEDIVQKFKEILDIDADVVTVLNFNKISEIPNMVTDTENIYKNEELPLEKLKKKIRIPKNNPVFDKIFEYINENYMYDIVRADVANHVFLESTYFSKLFKKNIGVTFYDYLLYVRITKAVELFISVFHKLRIYFCIINFLLNICC